ncbi:hypothetical protein AK812_SmicGene19949 [Symbiodinium microadriaticum]|uniref:Uncharacterized protein n=1 Tax=Symbiodinium microadriaticum TaxID=2951 RepID=A0A1Q9DR98_SYMMI|nr:hypothetical protein AK812_SmicGene19949 [Symbiodinium microadriaticum]CAE7891930.1 unnamed protein product [Symbiodinium microadriaticum]
MCRAKKVLWCSALFLLRAVRSWQAWSVVLDGVAFEESDQLGICAQPAHGERDGGGGKQTRNIGCAVEVPQGRHDHSCTFREDDLELVQGAYEQGGQEFEVQAILEVRRRGVRHAAMAPERRIQFNDKEIR